MLREKLNEYLKEALFLHDLPGLAIGVSVGKNLEEKGAELANFEYEAAAGFKNFNNKEMLLPEHIFHAASVTKLFVGTAIMQLFEQGRLDIQSKVVEILPYLSIDDKRYKDIKIVNLLTHTAGLEDVLNYCWDKPEIDENALRRYIESEEVSKSKLLWGPEEKRFKYSNIGYEILGEVIHEISGQTFDDYVEEHIIRRLGMNNSRILTFKRTEALGVVDDEENYVGEALSLENLSKVGLAMPHTKDENKHIVLEAQYPYNRAHGPSSTLTTSLNDIKIWGKAHLGKTILKPETYEKIWEEQALIPNNGESIGLSWFMRKQHGLELYGHEGSDDGFRASFWICPKLDMHIAVFSNLSQAPVKKIGKKVFDLCLGMIEG